MFNKPKPRRAPKLAASLIILAAAYFTGFARGVLLAEAEFDVRLQQATEAAFQQGLANQDWKQHAMSNPKLMNKLAHIWWFDLSHKDRKIDLEGKPKKW